MHLIIFLQESFGEGQFHGTCWGPAAGAQLGAGKK